VKSLFVRLADKLGLTATNVRANPQSVAPRTVLVHRFNK
jgi:hypothetical protein